MESVLELISDGRLSGNIPLHWNFPVHPVLAEETEGRKEEEQAAPAVKIIQRRLAAEKDVLLPMGYSGAYHSLLTDEELRQEYRWTFTNPGGNGFADIFGARPKLIMPSQMDFLRPSSRSFYNNCACTWLAVPDKHSLRGNGAGRLQTVELLDHGNMYYLPLLDLAPPAEDAFKAVKKFTRKGGGPLGVLVDFSRGNSAEDLCDFLETADRLRQKNDVNFVQLSHWLLPDRRQGLANPGSSLSTAKRVPGTMLPYISPPHDPADRVRRLEAGRKRFFIHRHDLDSDAEPYREIIITVSSPCKRSETVEHRPNAADYETPVERTLIADMPGTVVIKESDFEAEFFNGRFSNIISDRGPLLTEEHAASYISINEKFYPFENAGVYSFESEEVRGLREFLLMEAPGGGEGKLIIDYMFIGEYPSLFISADIQYPVFTKGSVINSYAPLELPLFHFTEEDSLTAAGVYPDGTQYFLSVPCSEGIYDLPGRQFSISKNDITFTLTFPEIEDLPVEIVPARVKTAKKGKPAKNSQEGCYPASTLDK